MMVFMLVFMIVHGKYPWFFFPQLLPSTNRHGAEAGAQHRRCLRLAPSLGAATEAAALQVVPGQQRLNLRDVARNASEAWGPVGPVGPVDDDRMMIDSEKMMI